MLAWTSRTRIAAGLIGLFLILVGQTAHAKSVSIAELRAANSTLRAELEANDAQNKTPPRVTDPAYQAQFAAAFDLDGLKRLDVTEVQDVLGACTDEGQLIMAYIMYGSKRAGIIGGSGEKATATARAKLMAENSLNFQDEISLATRFSVACTARVLDAVARDFASRGATALSPAQLAGLAEMQSGAAQIYVGQVQIQRSSYRTENKRIRIEKAVEFRKVFAEFMGPNGRQEVVAEIDKTINRPAVGEDSRAQLALIREAMTTATCSTICTD